MALNKEALKTVNSITKKYGEDSVIVASYMQVPAKFTTGSLAVDLAIGGGFPANQWTEIIGNESGGKTAFVFKAIAANQVLNPDFTVFWVASEHYDADQAEALGVDNSRIVVFPTQEMELAFKEMLNAVEGRGFDAIVLDSYPALIPNEEAAKEMDELSVALGARVIGKFFRKAGTATRRSMTDPDDKPVVGIIINQFRAAIGSFSPHGTPKTTPGGLAKNFAYWMRLEIARGDWIKERRRLAGEVSVGQVLKVTAKKNKSFPPNKKAEVDFYYANAPKSGFKRGDYDLAKETIIQAIRFNLIKQKGAWFFYKDQKWQGRDSLVDDLKTNPVLLEEFRTSIMSMAGLYDEEIAEDAPDSE